LRIGTQILLVKDLDLIEKGGLGTLKKDITEIEKMLKALKKSIENKPLNPWALESLDPLLQLNWRRTIIFKHRLHRADGCRDRVN
jgi:hypothetical protein